MLRSNNLLTCQSGAMSFDWWIFLISSDLIVWQLLLESLTASHCHCSLCHPISSHLMCPQPFAGDHNCSHLFSCHLSFSNPFSAHLNSSLLSSSQLFTALLMSGRLNSSHLISSKLLISALLNYSQLFAASHPKQATQTGARVKKQRRRLNQPHPCKRHARY